MVFIVQPKEEGEKKDCPSCGNPLIARLKVYKDYENKIQWQNKDDTNSHYDKDGNCKGITTSGTVDVTETTTQSTITQESSTSAAPESAIDTVSNDNTLSTAGEISKRARLLWKIRLQVESTIKALEPTPNGGMVWEMTKIIYHELYGDKS